ncbi:MAG TPA: ABC transporter permease [Propionibacteriaceae bacterium]|nr:ABC transporter permease [Propionibacteriaceae bacterium]
MTTLTYALRDSRTMVRRNLLHAKRYPGLTLGVVLVPVIFLLMFRFLLGETLGAGLASTGTDGEYVDYLAPGIIIMAVASAAGATAMSVSVDMTEGIINRFRTMAIARSSVLNGHVVGGLITTLLSTVVIIGVAIAVGFRPTAGLPEWLLAFGLLALIALALIWVSVGLGLTAQGPEAASNVVLPLQLLPLVASAFVPTESMPAGLRWFAEHQPFTPMIETLRGLLMGTPIGNNGILAVAWCCAIAVAGFIWSRAVFAREPSS